MEGYESKLGLYESIESDQDIWLHELELRARLYKYLDSDELIIGNKPIDSDSDTSTGDLISTFLSDNKTELFDYYFNDLDFSCIDIKNNDLHAGDNFTRSKNIIIRMMSNIVYSNESEANAKASQELSVRRFEEYLTTLNSKVLTNKDLSVSSLLSNKKNFDGKVLLEIDTNYSKHTIIKAVTNTLSELKNSSPKSNMKNIMSFIKMHKLFRLLDYKLYIKFKEIEEYDDSWILKNIFNDPDPDYMDSNKLKDSFKKVEEILSGEIKFHKKSKG